MRLFVDIRTDQHNGMLVLFTQPLKKTSLVAPSRVSNRSHNVREVGAIDDIDR